MVDVRLMKLASEFLQEEEAWEMYLNQAQQLESEEKFREGEKLYCAINQPNRAIAMYKQIGDYTNMMRLVDHFHGEHIQTNGRITMQMGKKPSELLPCSPDSAFGSEELEQDLDESFEYAASQKSWGTRETQATLEKITGTRCLTLPRTKNFRSSNTLTINPVNGLLPILVGHEKIVVHSCMESDFGLKFKPFNKKEKTSWLQIATDRGFIRLFDPHANLKRSLVVPCTMDTTAEVIAKKLHFQPSDLHVQLSGDLVRRLGPQEIPLKVQGDYLEKIGIKDVKKRQELGDVLSLGFLIRFYAGRPTLEDGYDVPALSSCCHVRKGRLFQQWSRRLCVLNGSRMLIYSNLEGSGDPEALHLARAKVEEVHLRSRGRCVKITVSTARKPAYTVYLAFDSIIDLNSWLSRCLKAAARVPPISDLSNLQLEAVPEQVFSVGSERLLTQLNLRHNALKERPPKSDPLARGYLEDLGQLQSLRSLNLADNRLTSFPLSLFQLPALTELILSSNKISQIPAEIAKLKNLQVLNLQNNFLSWLPSEMSELQNIISMDLSFNLFLSIPEVLVRLKSLEFWQLSGNAISSLPLDSLLHCLGHVKKLDLTRNCLKITAGIPIGTFENLSSLDLRGNNTLGSLDLRGLQALRTLYCQRTEIKNLQLNGTSLTYLFASNNKLESITVMPIPHNLKWFDVSCNNLTKIPEWLTELSQIERIFASRNRLTSIPHRLFTCVSSLKQLTLNHNQIRALPTQVENCFVEVLHLHHNKISQLPAEFLASTHKLKILNVAQNNLTTLPPLNPFQDLNKVQQLILSANKFNDSVFQIIMGYRRLRVLDLAYNHIRNIENRLVEKLVCLEDVNMSGNKLQCLPPAFATLPKLVTLRVHSNKLSSLPDFSRCSTLKVLDVGSNQLETVDIRCFLSPQLKHLDLACNPRLRLDMTAFKQFESERLISLVDMSQEVHIPQVTSTEVPWQCGFSETSGERNKLCISQIRIPAFSPSNSEETAKGALFGLIDGGLNCDIPSKLQWLIPEILNSEISRNADSSSSEMDTMKYTMITAHRSLESVGQKMGSACALCRILSCHKASQGEEESERTYRLILANVGHCEAVLCRKGKPMILSQNFLVSETTLDSEEYCRIREAGAIVTEDNEINGVTPCSRLLGCSFLHPAVIPDPHIKCVDLGEPDEFVILASRGLWEKMGYEEAVKRIRHIPNPILAAKHLQDMAQSYGYSENLSILVIRFFFNPNFSAHPVLDFMSTKLGQAQSAVNIAEQSDSLSTDDEIQSEPQGKPVKEKPNYYFEYKRKLKEFMLDKDTSSSSSDSQTLHCSNGTLDQSDTESYVLAVKGELSATDLDAAGYNETEDKTVERTSVRQQLNASFHSEVEKELGESKTFLTSGQKQLRFFSSHVKQNSSDARGNSDSGSSGLGKSMAISGSSQDGSFEGKTPAKKDAEAEEAVGALFQLVGKKKASQQEQVKTAQRDQSTNIGRQHRPAITLIVTQETTPRRRSCDYSEADQSESRQRFEAARQQVMEKLQLRVPPENSVQRTREQKSNQGCATGNSKRDFHSKAQNCNFGRVNEKTKYVF